jgi:hypothetical protein
VIASSIIFKDRLLEAEAENDLDDSDDDDDDDSDSDDVAPEVPDHDPLSEEEMDAELDSVEASDAADTKLDKPD